MMTGAKIILHAEMDAACVGLASLAGASWIMSLPQRQVPPGAPTPDGCDQVRLALIEAAREFIASVARDITPGAGSGSLGQSWAW